MNDKNGMVEMAGNLAAALCGNMALDVVERLTGLDEAASMIAETIDLNTITQQISSLMI